jgi:hypothetical protein
MGRGAVRSFDLRESKKAVVVSAIFALAIGQPASAKVLFCNNGSNSGSASGWSGSNIDPNGSVGTDSFKSTSIPGKSLSAFHIDVVRIGDSNSSYAEVDPAQ